MQLQFSNDFLAFLLLQNDDINSLHSVHILSYHFNLMHRDVFMNTEVKVICGFLCRS